MFQYSILNFNFSMIIKSWISFYPSIIYSEFLDKSFFGSRFKDETKIFAFSNSKLL